MTGDVKPAVPCSPDKPDKTGDVKKGPVSFFELGEAIMGGAAW